MNRSVRRGLMIAAGLGLVLALAACATPFVQSPLTPTDDFRGPRIDEAAPDKGAFVVQDGARLPYLRWTPPSGEPRAVIIALHGMNDHKASFRLAGPWWAEHGIETWSYDQRGFGLSPGRGQWAGDLMADDLRTITAMIRERYPHTQIAVAGESMGGSVTIAAFGSDRPPAADRVILLAPGVWGWSSQGVFNRTGLWLAARTMGGTAVEAPEWAVRNIHPSDNVLELIRSGRDPAFILSTRFDALYGLVDLMETATLRLGDVRAPTLLLYGAHDHVIRPAPMRRALKQAGERDGFRTAYYEDGWHLLNRDLQAETVYRDIAAWLADDRADLPSGAPPVLQSLTAKPR